MPNTETVALKPVVPVHGGDLGEAKRRFPKAPTPWLDLSTGINPVPYPVTAPAAEAWTRLPSRDDEHALLEAAARRYGVRAPSTVVAAPGTQALIQLLPRLVTQSRVAVLGPTYEEHEACWRRHGHDVRVVADIADASGADVIVAVNPNNPTGTLRQNFGNASRLLVVDEAFIDFEPHAASLAGSLPVRTVVLRSFGKAYGLAGLRLGFAIAEPDTADRLREELGPWAVSGPALEIGRRALHDDDWLNGARERLAVDGKRLDGLLRRAGCEILGGTLLFHLARHLSAEALVRRLGERGIHVRAFPHAPDQVRFGMPGDDAAFRRLADALGV